jgi:hypothetical protein
MNAIAKRLRQFLLAFLLLIAAVWSSSYYAQWALRWRAEHMLADIRSLNLNQTKWQDAQALMKKWSNYGVSPGNCTSDFCNYRITIVQSLPQMLVGYPDPGVHNWLPRIANHLGLRSAAARGGFSVEKGVVTAKWFAEQVTLPVNAWGQPNGAYTPDLAVSSGEYRGFPNIDTGLALHPYRRARDWKGAYGITVYFLPQEDPAEQTQLMNFQFDCITRFHPCRDQGDILPEARRMLEEEEPAPSTR